MSHSLHKHGITAELSTASALAHLDMGCRSFDFWIKSVIKVHIREPKIIKATPYIINMECANGFHFKIFLKVLSARKIVATPFSCL